MFVQRTGLFLFLWSSFSFRIYFRGTLGLSILLINAHQLCTVPRHVWTLYSCRNGRCSKWKRALFTGGLALQVAPQSVKSCAAVVRSLPALCWECIWYWARYWITCHYMYIQQHCLRLDCGRIIIIHVTSLVSYIANIITSPAYCSSVLFDKSTGILVFLRECVTLDEVITHHQPNSVSWLIEVSWLIVFPD